MTLLSLFLQSYGIGFVAAAILGPIGLVLIQRTIKHGWRVGVVSGGGVALADGLFGLAGALGLAGLTSLLVDFLVLVQIVGGGFLVYIGLKAFLDRKKRQDLLEESENFTFTGLAGAGVSMFLLTLTNPMSVMFFSAVYAGVASGNYLQIDLGWVGYGLFAGGIFSGSFSWWLILSSLISAVRQRFQLQRLVWLNRASGLLIAAFGVWVWVQVFVK